MTQKHDKNTEDILKDIPNGKIIINRHNSTHENTIFNKDFRYCSDGRGLVDTYSVFPGIELSFNYYYANYFEFQHRPVHSAIQINHCRSGRMGWKMQDQSTIYLGPGDLSLHTLHSCADSAMNLPLGYYQGVSVFIDLDALTATPPDIISEAGINVNNLYAKFCEQDGHTAMPASEKIEHIFSELYDLPERMYLPYFKLKVQELLLFLDMLDLENTKRLNQYVSGQVETIKEIHSLMTSDLKRHYTIEELSKQYLMNTTTLKSVFKAVYGMPIASYMKEYRMKLASNMLLQKDKSISEIAAAVGYKSQSKFTSAFRDTFQILPTAYQKLYRNQ